jgi:hypothetical protein
MFTRHPFGGVIFQINRLASIVVCEVVNNVLGNIASQSVINGIDD